MSRETRRRFVGAAGAAGLAMFAGCSSLGDSLTSGSTGSNGSQSLPEAGPKLTAADGDAEDEFGRSVAVDGATAVVGAHYDEDPNGENAGAAYVFERAEGESGDEEWTQAAKLVPDGGAAGDFFGDPVAVSDETVLVGASGADRSAGEAAGAAYVFEPDGDGWTRTATLAAADADSGDNFGSAAALAGDTAVVGAWADADPNGEEGGSAYVFERAGGEWTQAAKLSAGDGDSGDAFGTSVAAADGAVLVGAPEDEDPNGFVGGSAYVFERGDGDWSQTAKLVPDDGEKLDFFGGSVALAGGVALVGAMFDDADGEKGVGSAYVYERGDGDWSQTAHLVAGDRDKNDSFGESVSLAGDTALIGAPGNQNPNGEMAGSAYMFERSGGNWSAGERIAPDDGDPEDGFGTAVVLAGERGIVGAPGDEVDGAPSAGSAYLFDSV